MNQKKSELIKSYLTITLGLFIFALGWTAFLIPSEITGGGISGLAAVVFYATKIPIAVTYLSANGILLIIAIRILGFKYGFKTVLGVLILTGFFAMLQPLIKEPVVNEGFMACVIGGIMSGIGTGLVFSGGGSTGGTDIIASIVTKYRHISPGKILLYCDFIIIGSSYIVFGSIEKIVYGLTAMAVASYTIDVVLSGMKQSVQFFIFSKKYDEIADRIVTELGRGVTIMDGTGWYSKQPVKAVMVVARRNQMSEVFKIVKEVDSNAFITQATVMGVYGEGFEKIR